MDTIGKRLRAAREAAGVNQVTAAHYAGISASHLSKVEKNHDRPSLEVVLKLCILFRRDLSDIVRDDEELAGREVADGPDETAWLQAFRRMTPEQRSGALALLGIKRAS